MRALYKSIPFVLGTLFLLASCEHADPLQPPIQNNATLSTIQQTIFNTNCALSGCHAGSNPQQGMDLSQGQAHANIVGVPSRERPALLRVDPGNPDNSYLFQKITGAAGIAGARMPLGRSALSAGQIQLIRDWIADGALDN